MRVPQAMSTNRALAVTGDGTTALNARFAVPEAVEGVEAVDEPEAEAASGGRAVES